MTAPTSEQSLSGRELTRDAYPELADRPFLDEVLELFRCVRDHDHDTLSRLCDDDFGIVDVDVDGSSRVVRDRAGWEEWFTSLFARLSAMQARTDTVVDALDGLVAGDLGYAVCEFTQLLEVAGHVARFRCVTTVVFKRVDGRWVESRWHGSTISADVPEALARMQAGAG